MKTSFRARETRRSHAKKSFKPKQMLRSDLSSDKCEEIT